MLLGILSASFLGNMLTRKGINRTGYGTKDFRSKGYEAIATREGRGIIRAGDESEGSLIKTNF